jgi:hypothetical protein
VLASFLALACDRNAEDSKPSDSGEPASTPSEAPSPEPIVEPQPVEPEPVEPQTYEQKLERLINGEAPSADAEKQAWTHYKAKEFGQAQRMFALASLHDRAHWKHPFNLACASAMAEDEAMVQIGLVEAVARDQAATSKKARSDGDLARYRSAEWFEPILRGEGPKPVAPEKPVDPKTPEESPTPTPTPTPIPTPGAGKPLPPGSAAPLAKAKIEQLRDNLKQVHGLRPVVRGSVQTTNAEGQIVAWVVYDYTRYDACLLKHSKKVCRNKLSAPTEDNEDGESDDDQMKCTDQWLARATFGTTLVVDPPVALQVACTATQLRLDLLDLDGDGKQEVVLDLRGSITLDGFRESEQLNVGRLIKILRLDGSSQFELSFAWVASEIAPGHEVSKRALVRDVNGDGHLDLIVESVSFVAVSGGDYDADFWPTGDEEDQDIGPIQTEVWLYDPQSDTWKR